MTARIRGFFFDQDGVIIDTERDGHRVAFNRAFDEFGLGITWDTELYGELLQIGGGKERLRHFFQSPRAGVSLTAEDQEVLIPRLHERKTDILVEMLETGVLPLRPGVARIMREINKEGLILGVCTTSNERAARAITSEILRDIHFDLVLAGDVVAHKKPDPEIYNLALEKTGLDPKECIVIEDSHNGVEAAKEAGLFVVATSNCYTAKEDLCRADLVVTCLGDPDGEKGALIRGSLDGARLGYDGVLRAKQLLEHFGAQS